jgi:hypothetical protein
LPTDSNKHTRKGKFYMDGTHMDGLNKTKRQKKKKQEGDGGVLGAKMATPLVDGRLTVRRMRRVDWTVESTGDQVVEAIVCFGVTAPKGRGWF